MSREPELQEIPQRELRNHSGRILREVRGGHAYTVTVDGTPVADLVPHRKRQRRSAVPRAEVLAAFAGLSPAGHGSQDQGTEALIDDALYDPYDRAWRRGEFGEQGDT